MHSRVTEPVQHIHQILHSLCRSGLACETNVSLVLCARRSQHVRGEKELLVALDRLCGCRLNVGDTNQIAEF